MKNKEIPSTSTLMSNLKNEPDLNTFLNQNNENFLSENVTQFFNEMMKKYTVNKNEVIAKADIERSYCYQILRGTRKASRDNYLKIAIGIGMNLTDTQLLLRLTQTSPLYVKVKRDAAIIFCIEKHCDCKDTQELLYNQGLKILE